MLSLCPRVRKTGGKLMATTAWRLRLCMLGLLYREVVVDPKEAVVVVRRRLFWLFRRGKRYPFRSIQAVTYGYKDMTADFAAMGGRDTQDWFSVGLRLASGREIHLFHFWGDGAFTNDGPLPDWFYWAEYLTDMTGTQEQESKLFACLLGKMIGCPLAPPGL